MKLQSLDPRINRLEIEEQSTEFNNSSLDQGETYEAFIQMKEDKPYEHVGPVHAPTKEMAVLFAKEQYSRRGGTCVGLWIVETKNVMVSDYLDNNQNIYDFLKPLDEAEFENQKVQPYEIFHLKKRGKQHVHIGMVIASNPEEALYEAGKKFNDKSPVLNVWIIAAITIIHTFPTDKDIWDTLPEKKYREAIAYKAGEKLKKFKENNLNK